MSFFECILGVSVRESLAEAVGFRLNRLKHRFRPCFPAYCFREIAWRGFLEAGLGPSGDL